jgi:hypothetical protein
VETPNTFLWRPTDIRRAALRRLTASLFTLCPRVPRLIFCLAAQTPPELFTHDITTAVPVARIAGALEKAEPTDEQEAPRLFWQSAPPADDTPESALVQALIRRGLLLEPFARASAGLDELFGEADPGHA